MTLLHVATWPVSMPVSRYSSSPAADRSSALPVLQAAARWLSPTPQANGTRRGQPPGSRPDARLRRSTSWRASIAVRLTAANEASDVSARQLQIRRGRRGGGWYVGATLGRVRPHPTRRGSSGSPLVGVAAVASVRRMLRANAPSSWTVPERRGLVFRGDGGHEEGANPKMIWWPPAADSSVGVSYRTTMSWLTTW